LYVIVHYEALYYYTIAYMGRKRCPLNWMHPSPHLSPLYLSTQEDMSIGHEETLTAERATHDTGPAY
jgi:hypothetical protein